jgi:HEAT repeat protein
MECGKKHKMKNNKQDQNQLRSKSPLLDTMLRAITSFASVTRIEDFITGLKSDNSGIRGLAAGTLARVVSEGKLEGDASEAIPLLIILLKDNNIGTGECAAMALGAIRKISDARNRAVIASALRN